jgi:hypothetical protein
MRRGDDLERAAAAAVSSSVLLFVTTFFAGAVDALEAPARRGVAFARERQRLGSAAADVVAHGDGPAGARTTSSGRQAVCDQRPARAR